MSLPVGGHPPADHRWLLAGGGPDCLVADLDGTLVERGADAPAPAIVAALLKLEQAGAVLVVCTGRPTERALRVAGRLGVRCGFVVSCGGAETRDLMTGEVVGRRALTDEARGFLSRLADTLGLELSVHDSPVGALRLVLTGDAGQIGCALLAVDESLGGAVQRSRPSPGVLAVQAWAATKLEALATLLDEAGIDAARVAYVGDDADDAPALAWAGLGVAVAGGSREAEVAADVVVRPDELPELLIRLAMARRLRTAG